MISESKLVWFNKWVTAATKDGWCLGKIDAGYTFETIEGKIVGKLETLEDAEFICVF